MDRSKFHILEDGCQAFGVTLTEKQIEQFEKYYELLVEWNKVMNLTGITEFDEVMQKHFVDSVAAAEYVEMEKINSLIDVGTGAGFPGIPLKIVYPHLQVTLLDSLNKRIKLWITWGLSESKRCMEEQKMRRKKQNTANSLICRFPEQLRTLRPLPSIACRL